MHIIVASEGADRPEALVLASVLLLELIGSDDTQSPVFIEEIGNFRREVQLRSLGQKEVSPPKIQRAPWSSVVVASPWGKYCCATSGVVKPTSRMASTQRLQLRSKFCIVTFSQDEYC